MTINRECEFYRPMEIGERKFHGTFDTGKDIIDHGCCHQEASQHTNMVSVNGLCNTSHDYCPYNPQKLSDNKA